MKLKTLNDTFAIHRLAPDADIPKEILTSELYSITRTDEELSILCPANILLDSQKKDSPWSCIKVQGPLDFSLTGILARLSGILATAEISIFALSTFDTDYILVRIENIESAETVLKSEGYTFE